MGAKVVVCCPTRSPFGCLHCVTERHLKRPQVQGAAPLVRPNYRHGSLLSPTTISLGRPSTEYITKRCKSFSGVLFSSPSSAKLFTTLDSEVLREGIKKNCFFFFRKTPKGGGRGLAESEIFLSEKLRFFWNFFLKGGGPTYSKRVLS